MFAFGDPNENRDSENPTKQSFDTTTEPAGDDFGFGFDSSRTEETEEPTVAVDTEQRRRRRVYRIRSRVIDRFQRTFATQIAAASWTTIQKRFASVEPDSPNNENEFNDEQALEREEKPSGRRRNRGAQDSREESKSWKEDKRDQQSGSKKAAKKPTESKSHKRDLDTNEPERKKKKIPTWGEAIDFLIDKNLQNRKKPGNSGRKRRRR